MNFKEGLFEGNPVGEGKRTEWWGDEYDQGTLHAYMKTE
jgi:hypothetical protein